MRLSKMKYSMNTNWNDQLEVLWCTSSVSVCMTSHETIKSSMCPPHGDDGYQTAHDGQPYDKHRTGKPQIRSEAHTKCLPSRTGGCYLDAHRALRIRVGKGSRRRRRTLLLHYRRWPVEDAFQRFNLQKGIQLSVLQYRLDLNVPSCIIIIMRTG